MALSVTRLSRATTAPLSSVLRRLRLGTSGASAWEIEVWEEGTAAAVAVVDKRPRGTDRERSEAVFARERVSGAGAGLLDGLPWTWSC